MKSSLIVARQGGVRSRLLSTGSHTRRSGQLGSTFLTGVDRRVHAPLGTVVNFSGVLTTTRRRRRGRRCVGVVRDGGALLLRLVDSVLSLSGVRTNALRFYCSGIRLGSVVSRVRDIAHCQARDGNVRLVMRGKLPSYLVEARGGHLVRMLGGLLGGTDGFASRKDVAFNCGLYSGRLCFCIGSANYNVPTSGIGSVFKHFIGLGSFMRNAKLKLSVYRAVMRRVKKHVNIRSRRKGKSAF